ncbi:MAG: superoxide dismutase [Alistipes sp.]|nr:superoxide dismutase [Alistipes sp.]
MSGETLRYHHGKHVQAYVDNLNRLIPGTPFADSSLEEITIGAEGAIFDNGAQILNHIIFFDGLAPEAVARKSPGGSLAAAIDRDFGSLEEFKTLFNEKAAARFGSGWAWLVADDVGRLSVVTTPNAENPLREGYTPLLGIDLWEHSYYIDYRNRRAEYLDGIWRIVDWQTVASRYLTDYRAESVNSPGGRSPGQ